MMRCEQPPLQKSSRAPNCNCLDPDALVICPKFRLLRFDIGLRKCVVLNTLYASARNSRAMFSRNRKGKRRNTVEPRRSLNAGYGCHRRKSETGNRLSQEPSSPIPMDEIALNIATLMNCTTSCYHLRRETETMKTGIS